MSVSQSVFKFFAQTSPGLENILINELKSFGLKGKMRDDISHVQFQASYDMLFRILHESRTIESLKVQIGPQIKARGEDELETNVQKLPWAAFLPIETLHKYNQPQIHCKSYRSNLFHEKLITGIVEKQMNLLMIKKEYKAINSLSGGQRIMNKSLNREIKERKKQIDSKKELIILNRDLLKNSEEDSQIAKIPSLPDIHVYLVKDRATILMKLHFDSLHKHGLKDKVGWAPIKEGIIAGSLIQMNYKQKFQNELKIWDPFCGSGSIVLELLSMMFQQKIRNKFDFFFLKNFPQQEYEKYYEINTIREGTQNNKEQILDSSSNSEVQDNDTSENGINNDKQQHNSSFLGNGAKRISIIASDISNQAIQYSLENFQHSGLEETISNFVTSQNLSAAQQQLQDKVEADNEEFINAKQSQNSEDTTSPQQQEDTQNNGSSPDTGISSENGILEINNKLRNEKRYENKKGDRLDELAPFYIKESFCENRVRFIRSDFEALSKLINLRGYTIITNLPYGIRSSEHIADNELINSFKRFSKVIRKNLNKLQDVYVYTTVHEKYHRDHFINISRMAWTIKQKYTLGGLHIGLFELNKEVSQTCTQYQVLDEQQQQENEKRLAILETKLSKSNDDDEISKQLRQIIGDRSQLATMSPQEIKQHNVESEQKSNIQNLRKAASIEPAIISALDKKSHTPRQIKSIATRKKVEYANALRIRDLMQKSKFVENLNQKEIQRRIESKRNRNNTEFIKSVMESVGIEDKEDALQQIQEKLDVTAVNKKEKKQELEKKKEGKNRIPRWY